MEAKKFSTQDVHPQHESLPTHGELLTDEEVQERTAQVRQRFNNLILTQGADGKPQMDSIMLPTQTVATSLLDGTPGTCKVNASPWVPASSTEDGGVITIGLVTYRDQVIETVETGGKTVRVSTNLDRPPIPAVYYRVFDASNNLIDQQESFRVTPEAGVIANGVPVTHDTAQWEHIEALLDVFEKWYEQQTTPQWTAPERLKMMADTFTEVFKSLIAVCESTNYDDVMAALRNSQHAKYLEGYEQWAGQLRAESQRLDSGYLQCAALNAVHGVLIDAGFDDPNFVASTLNILQQLKTDAEARHYDDLVPSLEAKIETLQSRA